MASYSTPGVYIEDVKSVVVMPTGVASAAAFAGVAHSGPVGVPTAITSWNMYLKIFAAGLDNAFTKDSYLAYAVYGFFQNGGKLCYVLRVSNGTVSGSGVDYKAKKATVSVAEGGSVLSNGVFSAKYEGVWGNNLKVVLPMKGADEANNTFALQVLLNGKVVESWNTLGAKANTVGCYADTINSESDYIEIVDTTQDVDVAVIKTGVGDSEKTDIAYDFTGGVEGLSESGPLVPNNIYETALNQLDAYDSIGFVAIPGADKDLQKIVADYCTNNQYRIAICEGSITSTNEELIEVRNTLGGLNALLYAPWIKVTDPLSSNGSLIPVPACGHIAGVIARISDSRGFWKAPAGTEATIRGAVDVARVITTGETDELNPKGINAILPKTNYGIVVWGARSCNPDYTYASDLYTNITIKKAVYDLTQTFVFEPNNSKLWTKVQTTVQSYLQGLFEQGAFAGDEASEAYYVKCDEELNSESVRNQGKLICEIGYAANKPAEFIVFRISHELVTTS